jgi:hypothetical protein
VIFAILWTVFCTWAALISLYGAAMMWDGNDEGAAVIFGGAFIPLFLLFAAVPWVAP